MSERWKYQLRTGLPFGIILPIGLSLFEWFYTPFNEVFFTPKFFIRFLIFLVVGVFGVGYANWRKKLKDEQYDKQK